MIFIRLFQHETKNVLLFSSTYNSSILLSFYRSFSLFPFYWIYIDINVLAYVTDRTIYRSIIDVHTTINRRPCRNHTYKDTLYVVYLNCLTVLLGLRSERARDTVLWWNLSKSFVLVFVGDYVLKACFRFCIRIRMDR